MRVADLRNKIFFEVFTNTKQYLEMTAYATAKALVRRVQGQEYVASIYEERESLLKVLETIEETSGKKNLKWHKTRYSYRKEYVESFLWLTSGNFEAVKEKGRCCRPIKRKSPH